MPGMVRWYGLAAALFSLPQAEQARIVEEERQSLWCTEMAGAGKKNDLVVCSFPTFGWIWISYNFFF